MSLLLFLGSEAPVASLATTPLYEDFDNAVGEWLGYDTYDSTQRNQLALQKHVDIRSFEQSGVSAPDAMFDLDLLTMVGLDGQTMSSLETELILLARENWTAGTIGPQSDRRYFNGISLSCIAGVNTSSSVTNSVDISSFTGADYISLALPALPLATLTASSCFIDFTSEPSGNFAVGPTDSLAFSSSTTPLITGDSEARFPVVSLTHVNPAAITGIRFRIQATGNCTFRCLAIRAISSAWVFPPVDQNTVYDRVGASVPLTGAATPTYLFPTAAGPITPSDWPILLNSQGRSGPSPVDMQVGAIIQTGFNTAVNTFALYFRELAISYETMSALQGLTMTGLAGFEGMPGYLKGRLNDFPNTDYITATVQWGTSGSVSIKDQSGHGYTFNLSLSTQSIYYLLVQLDTNSLRVQIYPISTLGVIDFTTVVFDSTLVVDSNLLRRRQGRFGWYAQFNEGSTYVKALRPRRTVYGEYRSRPLFSYTPVIGAQVYPNSSPAVELYDGAVATPGTVILPDTTKSSSGACLSVQNNGATGDQGLVTAPIRFENFFDTIVSFDILAPPTVSLTLTLRGEGRLVQLNLPPFTPNNWTHMEVSLEQLGTTIMPGSYSFNIVQTVAIQSQWWIDNLSIPTQAVSWQGRQAADPWSMSNPRWIKYGNATNDLASGARFPQGRSLQVRGQILTQTAAIDSVKIVPVYAQLANFVWDDQTPVYGASPTSSFTAAVGLGTHVVNLDASASTAAKGINAYYWNFGDGNYGYGKTFTYQYLTGGTYVVTLVIVDVFGQKAVSSHTVTL